MNSKRMMRWLIVLFLLAVLPAMTAVVAQGQEPVGKQLPVVTEPGESQAPETWDYYESESNNTKGTADSIQLGYVMGGKIDYPGDIDYFKIDPRYETEVYLLDIEAQSIGSALDSVICMGDDIQPYKWECNDDTDTLDSLLFANPLDSQTYIKVTDYGDYHGGDDHYYELILAMPLLISAAPGGLGTGNVAGIPFQSGDVLAWSDLVNQTDKWVLFFDASDVGVKTLSNLSIGGTNALLFSVGASQTLPGLGTITAYDIVRFAATRIGPRTEGSFSMHLRGSTINLTTSSEKLDALESNFWSWDAFYMAVSTTGVATGDYKLDDEDLLILEIWFGEPDWNWNSYSFDINGVNDGSNPHTVAGLPAEDVIGFAFRPDSGPMYMTILGSGKIAGHRVTQKDIFSLDYPSYTWGGVAWHGPDHDWNYNIDAFDSGKW
ncbi:MAG: hypothetical protein KA170_00760 [Candidatus Promineofilum sp.]|nr:hypothetical protein [Promineifilum sp.]